jgi:glycosyltransferase involved in cell wall biosynthesis
MQLKAERRSQGGRSHHNRRMRVLYSFPHKLGAQRICHIAWQQVNGLVAAGADVLVFPGVLHKPPPKGAKAHQTLALGKLRISYKLLGTKHACALHDYIVARRIAKMAGQIDIIHTWPLGALRTLAVAKRLRIPTVLERPNAHTRFAYSVVDKECRRLAVSLPRRHEHAYQEDVLLREEEEYESACRLLCPSDFVVRTFLDEGFPSDKLVRHTYGFDPDVFFPNNQAANRQRGLTVLFAGVCAVRKGLHFALEAWLRSPAHREGTFSIAGTFIPAYAEKLSHMLSHPSVRVLGHRTDVPELMRKSDILILPTIEEGSALVTSEARASGCVLLVSDASGAVCMHMKNALVHQPGDVKTLSEHITLLHENRGLLESLRACSLSTVHEITWQAAGKTLLSAYRKTLASYRHGS